MYTRVAPRTPAGGLLIALVFSACSVAGFEQQAVDFAVDIKTEALALMDQATDDFANRSGEVTALRQRLSAASAFAAGRSNNTESITQWRLMADPNGNLLGGFLSRWEQGGQLSRAIIDGSKAQVSTGLDAIVDTENAKREE